MRRSRHGAVACWATAAALLAVAAPAAHAGLPTMPLAQVRPGMACTALSVVQGLEPTAFDGTVISVEGGPTPADALIIMRFSGDALGAAGIGEGYSGSPVSCPGPDGTPQVIGAISAGIGQYDNLVAGVTPIEAMLATPTTGTAPASPPIGDPVKATPKKAAPGPAKTTAKRTRGGRTTTGKTAARRAAATPLTATRPWGSGRIPLTITGPRGALADRYVGAAAKAGLRLLVNPAATRAQAVGGGLKGGDAVAATSIDGDVQAGAIGTVTYVDGDRVWAFGHAYNGTGPSRILMERAQISTIIGSPAIGDQVTYKLGSAVSPVGTIGFDGSSAIGGVLGPTPSMIPTNTVVRDGAGTFLGQATARIVDERDVRGGQTGTMLPLGASANAGTELQRLTRQTAVGGSARACTTIFLTTGEQPLYQCVDSIVPVPAADGGAESGVADAVAAAVDPVTSAERFLRLVQRVKVDVTFRPQADDLEIVRLRRPTSVQPGKQATVRVVVTQGATGERREIPLKVRIPLSAAGQRTAIVVVPDAVESGGASSDALDALFADDADPAPPKNLGALRALYTTDGISGLRAVAVPGVRGKDALTALQSPDDSDLDPDQIDAIASHAKLVYELPTYRAQGGAAVTVDVGP